MGLLLGSLRKCRGEDSVEHRDSGLSLKHHTTPLGPVLFSWRNNRIWYFTYQEQWSCFDYESTARDREKSPAEARAQHYVIMIAGPRKIKGYLMQPLEKVSSLIVQHRWEQYYLKWGGLKQEVKWMKRKAISWWICLIPSFFKRDVLFYLAQL